MWGAYFDESGNDGHSDAFVIGGYLMRSEDAKELDAKWRGVLTKYNLEKFHMVDCAHSNEEYVGIPVERRIDLVKDLIGLVHNHTVFGLCIICNPHRILSKSDVYRFCGVFIFEVIRDSYPPRLER
jgi:hypothetical protein